MKKSVLFPIVIAGTTLLSGILFTHCEQIETRLLERINAEDAPELFDDTAPNARGTSASIPAAHRIYQLIKVQTPCRPEVASQQYFYKEGDTHPYNQSDSVATLKNGYRSFTIRSENYGIWLKKTWDKTKVYTLFARDKHANHLVSIAQIRPEHTVWNFLPKFRYEGILCDCDGSERVPLH